MSGPAVQVVGQVLVADVVVVAVAMGAAALWSARVRRFAVVDAAWGATFVLIALAGAGVATVAAPGESVVRRWLVTAMVVVWGTRLARHLLGRVLTSAGDDPRYEEMLGGRFDDVPFSRVLVRVFLLQGVAVLLVAAPLVAGQTTATRWDAVVPAGVLLWTVGLVFESVGDAQLAAFRRDRDADPRPHGPQHAPQRGPILDTGLWAWTRHPNYFGDACVWWGVWLAGGLAAGPPTAALTLPAPVVMTWLLTRVSGTRLAERRMQGRPGWAAYAARTPMFLPRPPRHE